MQLLPASGLQLIRTGTERLDGTARTDDLAASAVAQVQAKHEVALGAALVRTHDDVLGTLLDVRA